MSLPRAFLVLLVAGAVSGCMHAARVFLDLEELEQSGQADAGGTVIPEGFVITPEKPELPPPPIEALTDPDSVLALLPTHPSGGVDWVAAMREGVIRPRPGEGAQPDSVEAFGYDLYLHTGGGPDAFFPHSEHQKWLSCLSCHPRIYRNGAESLTPESAHSKQSCAFCHGDVAFPIRACERCHEAGGDLPEGRIEKTLGAELTMERFDSTRIEEGRRRTGTQDLELVTAYPPARFPHGEHRIRFQCRACHERPFAMQRGSSVLTREEAHGGGACGACHNGVIAFETGINDCYRCHSETVAEGG